MAHLKLWISEKFRASKEAWHRDPSRHGSAQEVLPRQSEECAGPHSSADLHRPLKVGGIPQEDQETAGRQVLVLPRASPDVPVSCSPLL